MYSLPVALGEHVKGRRVVPAPRPDHLQVHGGRSEEVHTFALVLFVLHPPQRLFVPGLPRRLAALRVHVSHVSEKLQDSPVGRKVTASSGQSSATNKRHCEELQMGRFHNKIQ